MAWLCRACHSFVHGCARNEELAREVSGFSSGIPRDGVSGGSKEGGDCEGGSPVYGIWVLDCLVARF